MKLFSSSQTSSAAVFVLLFICFKGIAQGDSLSKINIIPQGDSLAKNSGMAQGDSVSKISGIAQGDSLAKNSGMAQGDSLLKNTTMAQKDTLAKSSVIEISGLTNIVLTEKNIRAYGWGEYRVGGHCLCCDNIRDGDCITVLTTNRTDRIRIKQIVDGKIEADTGDKTTYFGNVFERDRPEVPVAVLMAEITLKELRDIYKVIVYTIVDKEKKKSFLSNCELGYTDQFDRLQWAGKGENNEHDDHITFTMERPIFTKDILLKVKDGRSRITEVAIFTRNK